LLAHPLTASLDLDDPATTELRRQVIASKPFLKAIYIEWYSLLAASLPPGEGNVLELGSGAGFCSQFIAGLITSDVFFCPGARIVINAAALPFTTDSLRAIVMTNVLHHQPDVCQFFSEASRCLRKGGEILMIEPWLTPGRASSTLDFITSRFSPKLLAGRFPHGARLPARTAPFHGFFLNVIAASSCRDSRNLLSRRCDRSAVPLSRFRWCGPAQPDAWFYARCMGKARTRIAVTDVASGNVCLYLAPERRSGVTTQIARLPFLIGQRRREENRRLWWQG